MRLVGVLSLLATLAVGGLAAFDLGYAEYRAHEHRSELDDEVESLADAKDYAELADLYYSAPYLSPKLYDDIEDELDDTTSARRSWLRTKKKKGTKSKSTKRAKKKYRKAAGDVEEATDDLIDAQRRGLGAILAACLLAFLASVFVIARWGRVGGFLLVVAAAVPAIVSPWAAVATAVFAPIGLVAFIAGFFGRKKRGDPTDEDASATVSDAEAAPTTPMTRKSPGKTVVVSPDVAFGTIAAAVEAEGLDATPDPMVTPPMLPGEPELRSWANGSVRVVYSFNPVVKLRVLSVEGDPALADRLAAALDTIDAREVRRLLESGTERERMLGCLAAENLGLEELIDALEPLVNDPSEHVSDAARRTLSTLGSSSRRTPSGAAPTSSRKLVPRTVHEKHLYFELRECGSCGAAGCENLGHRLVTEGEDLVALHETRCNSCGHESSCTFVLPEEPIPPGELTMPYAGNQPSTLLDMAQWNALCQKYTSRVPASPSGLDAEQLVRGRDHARAGVIAMEEALKFIPEGDQEPPAEAFWSRESDRARAELPGQFKRFRLEARLSAFQSIARQYEEAIGETSSASIQARALTPTSTAPAGLVGGFDCTLLEVGAKKIAVIKVVREARRLDLKTTRDLVESAPVPILTNVSLDVATRLRQELDAAGAKTVVSRPRDDERLRETIGAITGDLAGVTIDWRAGAISITLVCASATDAARAESKVAELESRLSDLTDQRLEIHVAL